MTGDHADAVLAIYRAGIEEGHATFETSAPDWAAFTAARLPAHRYVAITGGRVAGWVAASAVSGGPGPPAPGAAGGAAGTRMIRKGPRGGGPGPPAAPARPIGRYRVLRAANVSGATTATSARPGARAAATGTGRVHARLVISATA